MKKAFIILGILIVVALVISCNPDQLSKTGQFLSNLSDAGLVSRNTKYVDEAAANVKTFIEESEDCFNWPVDPSYPPEGADPMVPFKDGKEQTYIDTVDKTVEKLLAARDSSAKDAVLRDALNKRYDGNNKNAPISKNLYNIVCREPTIGSLVNYLGSATHENRLNLVMMLASLGIRGVSVETLESGIDKMKEMDVPMPLSSMDYSIVVIKLMNQISSIMELVQNEGSGEKINIDMSILDRFQKDIKGSVGSREYQTVGDKIAVGIVFSVLNRAIALNEAYKLTPEYLDAPEKHKYDEFGKFILTGGKDKLDGVLGCLDAISYIYGVKLDLAGLVSSMI